MRLQDGGGTDPPHDGAVIEIPLPMRAPEQLAEPFSDPEWLYELKFDGYRCMAAIEQDDGFEIGDDVAAMAARVVLRTKTGAHCTAWFPEVMRALARLPGGPACDRRRGVRAARGRHQRLQRPAGAHPAAAVVSGRAAGDPVRVRP